MKNLKMFAIAIMAFAVMAMGVHAAGSCDASTYKLMVTHSEGYDCVADLTTVSTGALAKAQKGDTITLLDDVTESSNDITINNKVTIDLNGKTLTINGAHGIKVSATGRLTIKGEGTVENTDAAERSLITVEAGATLKVEDSVNLVNNEANKTDAAAVLVAGNADAGKSTSVSFGKNVTVTSKLHGLVVGDLSTTRYAKNTKVEMNGTWEADAYVVKVNGFIKNDSNAPVIDVTSGTYTSNNSTALYASGYADWTINATVKGAQAVTVRSGKVSITGGTYEAKDVANSKGTHDGSTGHAIAILGSENNVDGATYNDSRYIDVKITDGTFTANGEDEYAMYIGTVSKDTKLAISKGTFTSGKDADDNQLPAMLISEKSAQVMFDNHKDMISGGTFVGGLVGEVKTEEGKIYTAEEFTTNLVEGEVNTEGGNTTVGTPEEGTPGEGQTGTEGEGSGNQGNTDIPSNPNTNDNILVYAGLGLISLATVTFTTRKRED